MLDVSLDRDVADARRCILTTARSKLIETSPTLVLLEQKTTYTRYKGKVRWMMSRILRYDNLCRQLPIFVDDVPRESRSSCVMTFSGVTVQEQGEVAAVLDVIH
jgi:hypothetical protein